MYKDSLANFTDDMNDKSDAYKFLFGYFKKQGAGDSSKKTKAAFRSASEISYEWDPSFLLNWKLGNEESGKSGEFTMTNVEWEDKIVNLNMQDDELFEFGKLEQNLLDQPYATLDNKIISNKDSQNKHYDVMSLKSENYWEYIFDNQNANTADDHAWVLIQDDCSQSLCPTNNLEIFNTTLTKIIVSHKMRNAEKEWKNDDINSKENSQLNEKQHECNINNLEVNNTQSGEILRNKSNRRHAFKLRSRNTKIAYEIKEETSHQSMKWNCFSLGRTIFRGMSNYYKEKFDPLFKAWLKEDEMERSSMEALVTEFMKKEFKFNDSFYNSPRFETFLDSMIKVLHSQNYKKKDSYLLRRDFSMIRNLLYSYSANAKRSFVSNKNFAYIFNHFYNQSGETLVKDKSLGKPEIFKWELYAEMEDINKLAIKSITDV